MMVTFINNTARDLIMFMKQTFKALEIDVDYIHVHVSPTGVSTTANVDFYCASASRRKEVY
jgi:hypothetical protein